MAVQVLSLSILALTSLATATPTPLEVRDSGVSFTGVSNSTNGTSGVGSLSAAGTLSGFGGIGVGCGVNWESDVSYGGNFVPSPVLTGQTPY